MHNSADIKDLILHEMEVGHVVNAIQLLQELLKQEPNDSNIHYLLGVCFIRLREIDQAKKALAKAKELDPAHTDAETLLLQLDEKKSLIVGSAASPTNRLSKTLCPQCSYPIWTGSLRCPHCGHMFLKRTARTALLYGSIALAILLGLRYGLMYLYGVVDREAAIINAAGDDGKDLLIRDTRWFCSGMGVYQHIGRGYSGEVEGRVKNIGLGDLKKANLTIRFFRDNTEAGFVWFDVLNFRSGEEIHFLFTGANPLYRANRCEIRIEEVQAAEKALPQEERLSIYVPPSDQFPLSRFVDSQGKVLREIVDGRWERTQQKVFTLGNTVQFTIAFLLTFVAVFLGIITLNYCDPEMAWNENWRMEAMASLCVTIGIVVINFFVSLLSAIPFLYGLAVLIGLCWQCYLFLLFFQRSGFYSVSLVMLFLCYRALLQILVLKIGEGIQSIF